MKKKTFYLNKTNFYIKILGIVGSLYVAQ